MKTGYVLILVVGCASGTAEAPSTRTSGSTSTCATADCEETPTETSQPSGCDQACQPGETRCEADYLYPCVVDGDGCYDWGTGEPCPSGNCSGDAECEPCSGACDHEGDQQCSAGVLFTCELTQTGCLSWDRGRPCPTYICANDTTCE